MQLLYRTDSPVLMYVYSLICQGTVQVFGIPLPTFYDFFFLPLSHADNLSLSESVWTSNQSTVVQFPHRMSTHSV